jgi:hypothetical protein
MSGLEHWPGLLHKEGGHLGPNDATTLPTFVPAA